ncbi:response regulator [Paenibacillus roseipurpureus]|uniref:Response regulator n=1 Tax=Paenibacillus roseopurpureus TaxID=2918901 RepID=A0AA96LKP0_9BACL|nr:response regulator [Paenibacillus sp. MBLB1832]WNR43530.1 response regulator [Paenibacillus sp. MBLB1832]
MKVLLVDDEKHVRDAIRLLVNWKQFGIDTILEAQDGEAALAIVQEEHPEIIMTDMMMPVMNGVKLLEWLHLHAPDSKTIVISGHDDFSLLRHTVKYGGTDYILKPIDPDQLNEALDKAIGAWLKEEEVRNTNRELHIEVNQFKPIYWDKLLTSLISEPSTYEPVAEQLERELHVPKHVASCRVAILDLDTIDAAIKSKFNSNLDLLLFSLINICNEFLMMHKRGYAFRHLPNPNEIVILIWSAPNQAEELIEAINDGIRTALHTRVDIGIGSAHAFPAQLKLSYQEARDALRHRNLKAKDTWIHTSWQPVKSAQVTLTFHQYEESIHLAIRSGNVEQIEDIVGQWIDAVKSCEVLTPEQFELWWGEYRVMMRRWVQQFIPNSGEDEVNALLLEDRTSSLIGLDEKGSLSFSLWQQELTRSLIQVSKLHLASQHQDNNVIFEIAKYIEKHYHEDISLADIASRFYLSREYISRKFKQEFEVNLSDYLGQIRLSKAKVLLCNPNLRISQVAEMVGYQDEKYFSKVFKKMSGMTPNEYRKTANSI